MDSTRSSPPATGWKPPSLAEHGASTAERSARGNRGPLFVPLPLVVARNQGVFGGAIRYDPSPEPRISYCAFWDNGRLPFDGLDNPIGADGNVEVAPLFVDVAAEDPAAWDLQPAPGSPLLHAGSPALTDPDGSRSSIGAYGGPGGAAWDLDVAPPGVPSVP